MIVENKIQMWMHCIWSRLMKKAIMLQILKTIHFIGVKNLIYLWREVDCFVFCNYDIHQTEMLQIVFFWCRWKALNKDGCMGFGSMAFGLVVQKFLNIEWFLHWKFKKLVAENSEELECAFGSWKELDAQDLMEFIW